MGWHSGRVGSVLLAGALAFTLGTGEARAQKAPPAPPTKVRQFPKPTSPPPVPRIIRLAPGQKVITPAQLRKAPTVYETNKRGSVRVSKPLSRPAPMRIPGAPRILHDLPLPESKSPPPVPVPKKPSVKHTPKH